MVNTSPAVATGSAVLTNTRGPDGTLATLPPCMHCVLLATW
jgi:hypothetical protein